LGGAAAGPGVGGDHHAQTLLEDRLLREELTGYASYANRVRYRLLPDVW
jgi:protein-S-isoprenylcysteine O-methyltransferase Ste14